MLISVELEKDLDVVNIILDNKGVDFLIEQLERVKKLQTHEHLTSSFFGGDELSNEPLNEGSKSIHMLNIGIYKGFDTL